MTKQSVTGTGTERKANRWASNSDKQDSSVVPTVATTYRSNVNLNLANSTSNSTTPTTTANKPNESSSKTQIQTPSIISNRLSNRGNQRWESSTNQNQTPSSNILGSRRNLNFFIFTWEFWIYSWI